MLSSSGSRGQELKAVFEQCNEKELAWQMLACEIGLELDPSPQLISDLLSLYMRAVEILNSQRHPAEPFFCSKMSQLMNRPAVIKTFNANVKEDSSPDNGRSKRMQARAFRDRVQTSLLYEQESSKQSMEKLIFQDEISLKRLETTIKEEIQSQQEAIQERINRKRRSQSKSDRSMGKGCTAAPVSRESAGGGSLEVIQEERKERKTRRQDMIESILGAVPRRDEDRRSISPRRMETRRVELMCEIAEKREDDQLLMH